jgi:hemerythrin
MALMEWTPAYSVEVEAIDLQHRKLFAMVNELHSASREGKGAQLVPRMLKDLVLYTQQHFAFEEQLMRKGGCPHYAEHKAEHEKLAKQVTEMAAALNNKGVTSTSLMFFLCNWLKEHISGHDKKYVPYV